ncbi:Uma2 family endonuclease [Micromonospora sp. CPCC 205556]|uniref:Uma2 family endonuclease n=1 Tax=Micromonospora sp. CPCC 205556 TaxID=3122398 RepID=UPI002FF049CE
MSAEPIATPARPWFPDPTRQQRADYTLEDLLKLPDDAPRVELVDGVVQVTPSPTLDHQDISSLLWMWLRAHAPGHLRAAQAVGVALDANASRQPDVLLCRADVSADRPPAPAGGRRPCRGGRVARHAADGPVRQTR